VNFYKHHLGDYAAATMHLSWDEDCAYRRLLEQYYKREAPIPVEIKEACRLARASTPSQKRAVETVLKEFFVLESTGWHQKRCDEEIGAANAQADTNRRIAEEREARRRPRTEHEPCNESLNESSTPPAGERDNFVNLSRLQTPDSRHQTPDSNKESRETRASRLSDDWLLTDERRAIAQTEKLDPERTFSKFTDYWRAASGANARKRDWNAAWRNWCRNEADRKPKSNGNGKLNGNHANDELPLGKFDRLMQASHAKQTFNADGQPVDENGKVIPF
jgi:uncharacterized protein YdaU (DUF1376 family)